MLSLASMLLLLATLALGVSADLYTCQNQTIAVGANGYQMRTSTFAPNQNCILQFAWPKDQYATLTMNIVNHNITDVITFFSTGADGSLNQTVQVYWQIKNPNLTISWPLGIVSLNITTEYTTELSFSLTITTQKFFVENAPTTTLRPAIGVQPFYIPFSNLTKNTAISVESSDKIFAQFMLDDWRLQTSLANFFVYEGTGKNLKLIGSMHSFNWMITETWLYNSNFTIYSAANDNLDGVIFINDNRNNPDDFQFYYSTADVYQFDVDVDGVTTGCTMAIKEGFYLETVYNTNPAPLKMLAGGPIGDSNATLLTTYGENIINQLPQFIPRGALTFLAPGYDHWILRLIESNSTKSLPAYNKQTGFIISDNYPFLSSSQNSQPFKMESGDLAPFTIAFTFATKSPNKEATAVVNTGNGNPTTINLNSIMVPYTRAFTTKSVSLVINGGSAPSNGTYITYTVASTFNRTQ